jgi:hypothetical protein
VKVSVNTVAQGIGMMSEETGFLIAGVVSSPEGNVTAFCVGKAGLSQQIATLVKLNQLALTIGDNVLKGGSDETIH